MHIKTACRLIWVGGIYFNPSIRNTTYLKNKIKILKFVSLLFTQC